MGQGKGQPEKEPPEYFISHRHEDKNIADVIRMTLNSWGVPGSCIFQSSHARHGLLIGQPLERGLRKALEHARLVLLPYTFSHYDWSFPMWETGVATNPTTKITRIVVFQCTEDEPSPFRGDTRLNATSQGDILKFTEQFHTTPDFLPGKNEAFAPNLDAQVINSRAAKFHEDMRKEIPPGRLEERPRWDYLTLELAPLAVKKVEGMNEENRDKALSTIRAGLMVKDGFGVAARHFGFDALIENAKFRSYVDRWKQVMTDTGKEAREGWIDALCIEIWRAIRKMSAEPTWEYLRSGFVTDWWFYPILNHARILPDNRMEFELYLYRTPAPAPTA